MKKETQKEVTLQDVAKSVENLSDRFENLSGTVENLSKTVENLSKTVDNTVKSVENLSKTVENLSRTVEDVAKSVENLAMMTQRGFEGVESRMTTKEEMTERFNRVENILYRGHDNRLERLEDDMLRVKTFLGKKLA
jgi:methyl-accepting chemotaxis protein